MLRTIDTKEELEYFRLLYNFEDTERFCKQKILKSIDCKNDVRIWLREVNSIVDSRKNHSHFKFLCDLKRNMEGFLKQQY